MYRFLSKHSSDHYALFCHDPLSHLAIDASSCMKLMHTRTDFKLHSTIETTLRNKCYCKSWNAQKDRSLRKICHYQQNVPQDYYLLDTLVSCHRKCSQTKYRKVVLYSTILNPTFPASCTALLVLSTVFSMAWHKLKGSYVYNPTYSMVYLYHSKALNNLYESHNILLFTCNCNVVIRIVVDFVVLVTCQ